MDAPYPQPPVSAISVSMAVDLPLRNCDANIFPGMLAMKSSHFRPSKRKLTDATSGTSRLRFRRSQDTSSSVTSR